MDFHLLSDTAQKYYSPSHEVTNGPDTVGRKRGCLRRKRKKLLNSRRKRIILNGLPLHFQWFWFSSSSLFYFVKIPTMITEEAYHTLERKNKRNYTSSYIWSSGKSWLGLFADPANIAWVETPTRKKKSTKAQNTIEKQPWDKNAYFCVILITRVPRNHCHHLFCQELFLLWYTSFIKHGVKKQGELSPQN